MSMDTLIKLPISSSRNVEDALVRHSLVSTKRPHKGQRQKHLRLLIVEAKGKKGMAARQCQRTPPPPLPKIEDDGNPRFVIFIRMANVSFSFSLPISAQLRSSHTFCPFCQLQLTDDWDFFLLSNLNGKSLHFFFACNSYRIKILRRKWLSII